VLEAFPDHFRGAPRLERVVFRIIPAEITRFNDYKAGNLDVTDIPTGHCRAVKGDPVLKAQVAIWPTLGTHAVRFNVEKPPFNDRRIRLAVAHAIDPSGVVQGLLEGCVIAGKGILPPALPGYNPEVTAPGFDRAKARALLAEAGFPGGPRARTDHVQLQHRRSQPADRRALAGPSSARWGSPSSCGASTGPPI